MTERDTNLVVWKVDDTEYPVDIFDLTGTEFRDARQAAGRESAPVLVDAALIERDIEAIAAFLWVHRRRSEPDLTYDEVLGDLTYGALATKAEETAGAS